MIIDWIGGIIMTIIICATVLITVYLYYCAENDAGCFEKLSSYRLKDLEEQQEELVKEIQELKEIIKEQNPFNGFTIQK